MLPITQLHTSSFCGQFYQTVTQKKSIPKVATDFCTLLYAKTYKCQLLNIHKLSF